MSDPSQPGDSSNPPAPSQAQAPVSSDANPQVNAGTNPQALERNVALKRDVESLRDFIRAMQSLMQATEDPVPDSKLFELLRQVLADAVQAMQASDGSLLVLDEDTNELVFVVAHGEVPHPEISWRRLPPGEGVAGWVARYRRPTIVNDTEIDDRFYSNLDRELGFETKSLLAAPIVGNDRVLGVIEILNKVTGEEFDETDKRMLTLLCRFCGELLHSLIKEGEHATEANEEGSDEA